MKFLFTIQTNTHESYRHIISKLNLCNDCDTDSKFHVDILSTNQSGGFYYFKLRSTQDGFNQFQKDSTLTPLEMSYTIVKDLE